jgi:hypothetical protein
MIDLLKISDKTLAVAEILARREVRGQITVQLLELASLIGVKLAQLHPIIDELVNADVLLMERLHGGDTPEGVLSRFRWNEDPAKYLAASHSGRVKQAAE